MDNKLIEFLIIYNNTFINYYYIYSIYIKNLLIFFNNILEISKTDLITI